MKDFKIYEKPRDLKLHPQSWNDQDFYDMTRKQQNLKMYKVGFECKKLNVNELSHRSVTELTHHHAMQTLYPQLVHHQQKVTLV